MIELHLRAEIFQANPFLASVVRSLQSSFDPDAPQNRDLWEGCEAEAALFWTRFRDPDLPEAKPPFAGSLTLRLPSPGAAVLAASLPGALARMMETVGVDVLAFVHVGRSAPWPTQRRRPPGHLAESARRFRALGAGKGFDGALVADLESLGEVLEPLFWSIRMDGGYGDVVFAPADAPFVGGLCQYGNVHLDVYAEDALAALREAAGAAGFEELPGFWACGEPGAIEGRATRVE